MMNNELVIFETKDNDIKLDVPVDKEAFFLCLYIFVITTFYYYYDYI